MSFKLAYAQYIHLFKILVFIDDKAGLFFLNGPISLMLLSNIIFFAMMVILFYRTSIDTAVAIKSNRAKQKYVSNVFYYLSL